MQELEPKSRISTNQKHKTLVFLG